MSKPRYTERLLPGFGLYLALGMFFPAVWLVALPIAHEASPFYGLAAFFLAAVTVSLTSPVVTVTHTNFQAGRATLPLTFIGDIQPLGVGELAYNLGPGLDARSYTLVRGWIKTGVKIANIDPADPAPYWIVTTRHPEKLRDAIKAAGKA